MNIVNGISKETHTTEVWVSGSTIDSSTLKKIEPFDPPTLLTRLIYPFGGIGTRWIEMAKKEKPKAKEHFGIKVDHRKVYADLKAGMKPAEVAKKYKISSTYTWRIKKKGTEEKW